MGATFGVIIAISFLLTIIFVAAMMSRQVASWKPAVSNKCGPVQGMSFDNEMYTTGKSIFIVTTTLPPIL